MKFSIRAARRSNRSPMPSTFAAHDGETGGEEEDEGERRRGASGRRRAEFMVLGARMTVRPLLRQHEPMPRAAAWSSPSSRDGRAGACRRRPQPRPRRGWTSATGSPPRSTWQPARLDAVAGDRAHEPVGATPIDHVNLSARAAGARLPRADPGSRSTVDGAEVEPSGRPRSTCASRSTTSGRRETARIACRSASTSRAARMPSPRGPAPRTAC